MKYFFHLFLLVFLFFFNKPLVGQPESKFLPFDWIQYKKSGKINSLSFSDRYTFIGTENSGILRFDFLLSKYDFPITKAQGLKSNTINLVHYLSNGSLWVLSNYGLEFSFNSKGDWRNIPYNQIGFSSNTSFESIGSTEEYLWIKTSDSFYKFDIFNGYLIGRYSFPSGDIKWSSKKINNKLLNDIIYSYSFIEGWLVDRSGLISPIGDFVEILSIGYDNRGDIWLGASDGTLFYSNKTMKLFYPYRFQFSNNNIQDIEYNYNMWVAGRIEKSQTGITMINTFNNKTTEFFYDDILNIDNRSVFSILDMKDETWFGGQGLLIYDKEDKTWTDKSSSLRVHDNRITKIIQANQDIWIGTTDGLIAYNSMSKKIITNFITEYLDGYHIIDIFYKDSIAFITSNFGLEIIDIKNKKIYKGNDFGYSDNNFSYPTSKFSFTDLFYYDQALYVANRDGIISFNYLDRSWSNVVNASIFGGTIVHCLAVDKKNIFISTINGIYHYNISKKNAEFYSYNFLGKVNDMYINNRILWIGTSEGLFSFRYKQ